MLLGVSFGELAVLAAVGCGEYKNIQEACKATIRVVHETKPNKEAAKFYDRGFPVYQRLYQSLRKDFQTIAKLAK